MIGKEKRSSTKKKKVLDEGIINNSRDNKRGELCKGERDKEQKNTHII